MTAKQIEAIARKAAGLQRKQVAKLPRWSITNPSQLNLMNYRAPIVVDDVINDDVANLLTDAQWRWFAIQSTRLNKSVRDLILQMKPMVEQINDESNEVYLFGYLPNCNLYGCVRPDGSSHT